MLLLNLTVMKKGEGNFYQYFTFHHKITSFYSLRKSVEWLGQQDIFQEV